jgi:hypothetical protein
MGWPWITLANLGFLHPLFRNLCTQRRNLVNTAEFERVSQSGMRSSSPSSPIWGWQMNIERLELEWFPTIWPLCPIIIPRIAIKWCKFHFFNDSIISTPARQGIDIVRNRMDSSIFNITGGYLLNSTNHLSLSSISRCSVRRRTTDACREENSGNKSLEQYCSNIVTKPFALSKSPLSSISLGFHVCEIAAHIIITTKKGARIFFWESTRIQIRFKLREVRGQIRIKIFDTSFKTLTLTMAEFFPDVPKVTKDLTAPTSFLVSPLQLMKSRKAHEGVVALSVCFWHTFVGGGGQDRSGAKTLQRPGNRHHGSVR